VLRDLAKRISRKMAKYLLTAVAIAAAVTVLTLLFSRLALGYFTAAYIFIANFTVGGFMVFWGLSSLGSPTTSLSGGRRDGSIAGLEDHNAWKNQVKHHRGDERKNTKFIYIGIGVVIITALAQFLMSLM
jgi:hypothetical protein